MWHHDITVSTFKCNLPCVTKYIKPRQCSMITNATKISIKVSWSITRSGIKPVGSFLGRQQRKQQEEPPTRRQPAVDWPQNLPLHNITQLCNCSAKKRKTVKFTQYILFKYLHSSPQIYIENNSPQICTKWNKYASTCDMNQVMMLCNYIHMLWRIAECMYKKCSNYSGGIHLKISRVQQNCITVQNGGSQCKDS